jgi:hypothetical protein
MRNDGLNQGIFTFNVYPPLLNLKNMDLSAYLNFSCASTYTI